MNHALLTRLARIMLLFWERHRAPRSVHKRLGRRVRHATDCSVPGSSSPRNQEHASSDGGAVLLKANGLVKAFARCLADKRAPGKIRHTLADLRPAGLRHRVRSSRWQRCRPLADDPIHKLLLGRDPVSGAPLASQPTISRFENGARRSVLYRMGRELAACVIERHRRRLQGRARRITIDLDPTDDLTHGAQQLTFFNGHYGGGVICRCWGF